MPKDVPGSPRHPAGPPTAVWPACCPRPPGRSSVLLRGLQTSWAPSHPPLRLLPRQALPLDYTEGPRRTHPPDWRPRRGILPCARPRPGVHPVCPGNKKASGAIASVQVPRERVLSQRGGKRCQANGSLGFPTGAIGLGLEVLLPSPPQLALEPDGRSTTSPEKLGGLGQPRTPLYPSCCTWVLDRKTPLLQPPQCSQLARAMCHQLSCGVLQVGTGQGPCR